jgi:amylosucrase
VYETGNDHVFAYLRAESGGDKVLCLVNFSEFDQWVEPSVLEKLSPAKFAKDLITGVTMGTQTYEHLKLTPYQVLWMHTTP